MSEDSRSSKTDMSDSHDSETTRRSFLSTFGIAGVGSLPNTAGILGTGKRDSVEIVTHRTADGPAKTEQVPASWYNRVKAARRASQSLKRQYLSHDEVAAVGITAGDEAVDGHRNHRPYVHFWGDSISQSVPEVVDGVPVEIRTNRKPFEYHCYENDYDPVRGGIVVGSDDNKGSACCRVYYNGEPYLLTVRHMFDTDDDFCNDGEVNYEGEILKQNLDYFGYVAKGWVNHDAVIVRRDSDGARDGLSNGLVDSNRNVVGYVTKDGVANFMSSNETQYFRGITTCTANGPIVNYDESYTCDSTNVVHTDFVVTNFSTSSGDSGGIVFHKHDGDAYMTNMHSGTPPGLFNDNSAGVAGYALNYDDGVTPM